MKEKFGWWTGFFPMPAMVPIQLEDEVNEIPLSVLLPFACVSGLPNLRDKSYFNLTK